MFKIGDRVKVIDGQDGVGCQGEVGHIVRIYHVLGDPRIEVQIHSDTFVFWEHELQLIPMALASAEPSNEVSDHTVVDHCKYCGEAIKIEAICGGTTLYRYVNDCCNDHASKYLYKEKEERGLRHDAGKPEIHQVPPSLIIAVAEVLKYGEQKYAKGNWKKGMDWVKPYDCLMRHMFKWLAGEEEDEESGLSHLYHAAANIAMLIEYKETCPELDNREF